jgi:hypothetical protein
VVGGVAHIAKIARAANSEWMLQRRAQRTAIHADVIAQTLSIISPSLPPPPSLLSLRARQETQTQKETEEEAEGLREGGRQWTPSLEDSLPYLPSLPQQRKRDSSSPSRAATSSSSGPAGSVPSGPIRPGCFRPG